jgi:hypothetical protein
MASTGGEQTREEKNSPRKHGLEERTTAAPSAGDKAGGLVSVTFCITARLANPLGQQHTNTTNTPMVDCVTALSAATPVWQTVHEGGRLDMATQLSDNDRTSVNREKFYLKKFTSEL